MASSFSDLILERILHHSKEQKDRPAIVSAENEDDYVTYGQFYNKIGAIAAFLDACKFGKGDIAAVVLPNCWQYLALFIACANRRGAISGTNSQFTQSELAQQFSASQCKLVFCSESTLEKVLKAVESCPLVEKVIVVSLNDAAESPRASSTVIPFSEVLNNRPIELKSDSSDVDVNNEVLLLPFSSGTTGVPKGVMLTHKSFGTMMNIFNSHFDNQVLLKLDSGWRWSQGTQCLLLPLYHIYGFGLAINCLLAGGKAILLKQFDGDLFCRIMQNHQVNHGMLVPPILVFLAKSPVVSRYDLSSMKFVMTGGAPAGPDLVAEVMKRLPSIQQISQGYGMTEESMASHLPVFGMENTASAGRLMSNLEMKILDVDTRRILPLGETGEICIRGPTIMKGYFNRPDATAETIDEDGWLKTGDVGYQDEEGWTYIVDRLKELIKVKGFQVAPAELEDLLLSHPGIKDCAVIGVQNPVAGEVPKAFIVKGRPDLTEKEVHDFVKEHVANFKQLKGGIEFIEAIPKSPAGKILRRLLRK